MDRFEVNVQTLPIVNGSRLNPSDFLNYIRLNINNFINTDIATFVPYLEPSHGINDNIKWASNDPLGTMLHIKMDDNGSVILSDHAPDHWTVSTIRTPMDGNHPVTGNRSWGYKANPNGSFTFYVTGADRLTAPAHQIAQALFGIPFSGADKLWMSFQNKLSDFINAHQGNANVGSVTTERPDYAALKDYFDGKITIEQLKAKGACI